MSKLPIVELEQKIGHNFSNRRIIQDALTHSSTGQEQNYERLEFLGDRVLGLVIAEILYQKFPDEAEGDLAKRLSALVQGKLLAELADQINLGAYIDFSEAERQAGGTENANILADVFEAVIGALYLDSGFEKCQDLIETFWADQFFEMKEPPQHPKTALQEWVQAKGLPLPEYKIIKQSGPDHAPVFDVQLCIEGYDKLVAQGKSRQEAERQAAQDFIDKISEQGA